MYYDKLLTTCLVITFLIFLFPRSVSAASAQISNPPSSVSKSESITINISFSGSPNKEHYLKVRLGQGSTLTKALTNNPGNSSPDDWLSDSDSYSKFPKVTTDSAGNYNGQVVFKTSESVVIGENQLLLRVRPLDTSTNIDSPASVIQVQDSTPSTTTTQAETQEEEVTISSHPGSVVAGEEYEVAVDVVLEPNKTVAAKVLMGTSSDSKDMKSGSTQGKNSAWLAWNSAWDKFSEFVTDNSGTLSLRLKAKTNSDVSGTNYMVVRIRDIESEKNYDSAASSFQVQSAPVVSESASTTSETDTASSISQSTVKKETSTNSTNSQGSAASTKTETKSANAAPKKSASTSISSKELAMFDKVETKPVGEVLGEQVTESKKPIPTVSIAGFSTEVMTIVGVGVLIILTGVGLFFKESLLRRMSK